MPSSQRQCRTLSRTCGLGIRFSLPVSFRNRRRCSGSVESFDGSASSDCDVTQGFGSLEENSSLFSTQTRHGTASCSLFGWTFRFSEASFRHCGGSEACDQKKSLLEKAATSQASLFSVGLQQRFQYKRATSTPVTHTERKRQRKNPAPQKSPAKPVATQVTPKAPKTQPYRWLSPSLSGRTVSSSLRPSRYFLSKINRFRDKSRTVAELARWRQVRAVLGSMGRDRCQLGG